MSTAGRYNAMEAGVPRRRVGPSGASVRGDYVHYTEGSIHKRKVQLSHRSKPVQAARYTLPSSYDMPVGNEEVPESTESNACIRRHPPPNFATGAQAQRASLEIDHVLTNYGPAGLNHDTTTPFGRPPHRLMRLQTFSLSELNPTPVILDRERERDRPLYSLGRPFPEPSSLRRRSPTTALIGDLAAQMNLQTASVHNMPLSANRPPESRVGELAAGSVPSTGMHILRLGDLSQDQYIVATPELLRSFVEETRKRDSPRVSASFIGDDHHIRHSREESQYNISTTPDYHQNHDLKNQLSGKQELSASTAVESSEKINNPVNRKSHCSSQDHYVRGPGGIPRPVGLNHAEEPTCSSRYRRYKAIIREPAAEAMGEFYHRSYSQYSAVSVYFKVHPLPLISTVYLTANSAISPSPKGSYSTQCIGSAIGVMIGVYVAGGISGGHLNPTVTIALAIFRDFKDRLMMKNNSCGHDSPWQKVIPYCGAQVFGGLLGSLTIHLIYAGGLDLYEGGEGIRTINGPTSTAGFFLAFPAPYMSSEIANVSLLIFAVSFSSFLIPLSSCSSSWRLGTGPIPRRPMASAREIVFMCVVIGVAFALGSQTSYALNPALDLASRIVVSLMGYGTSHWSFRDQYWLWNNWISNMLGAVFGCFLYDFFVSYILYEGKDSPLNRPWSWSIRRPSFGRGEKPLQEVPTPVINGEHYV
ncbi:hypothetical protein VP01_481g6 [Puccinia sorghi]|uniref:Aquaporin n=1 Tax=Puccinia sorghi TaxID=27349 RepID=A0A0L6UMH9_9BASI|nr:hypothetical protein VP01_481g6 [Puccinia sorghi]